MERTKLHRRSWFILLVLYLGAFVVYWPVLGKSFTSDDFLVLRRVGLERVIFIKDFFRPLSDITLYFSYMLGGFNPMGYWVLSVLVHAGSAFVFFRFCWLWKWAGEEETQWRFAFLSAVLFLFYPFHNEAVVWATSRGPLFAGFLGMCSLVAVVSKGRRGWRIFVCCLCYFIGMSGYESVIVLPVMVFILLYSRGLRLKEYGYWAAALGSTLLLHLFLRRIIAGTVSGDYGATFFRHRFIRYVKNLFTVVGRLFLPPTDSARLMAVLFLVLMGVIGVGLWFFFFRRYRERPKMKLYLIQWLLLLGVTLGVPTLGAVSSHTSESDRFLYFPSFFVCGGVAFLLTALVRAKTVRWVTVALVVYCCFFLELNNSHWIRASAIVRQVLSVAEAQPPGSKLFLVNLPDEVEGAYVFRLGLPDAMIMDGKDTSGLVIVNHLPRDSALLLPDSIGVVRRDGVSWLAPGVRVVVGAGASGAAAGGAGGAAGAGAATDSFWISAGRTWKGGGRDKIVYWNKRRLVEWPVSH